MSPVARVSGVRKKILEICARHDIEMHVTCIILLAAFTQYIQIKKVLIPT